MNAIVEAKRYTPEDLLRMPEGKRYELLDGHLVERIMSFWSSYVAGNIHFLLMTFCRANKRGWVAPEGTSYQCFPDEPEKVRRPDVSYIDLSRMTLETATTEGHLKITPDLTVEVVSPNDLAYEIAEKVQDFRKAGVKLIWVVNPQDRSVAIYRGKGKATIASENDDLDGESVLPGFSCRVGELSLAPGQVTAG